MVVVVKSLSEFNQKLKEAGDKLVVVDFTASWCPPCKMIAPKFEKMSEENSDVVFLKVDVEDSGDVAKEYEISAMPTFIFFKNGKQLHSFQGASEAKLKEGVKKWK